MNSSTEIITSNSVFSAATYSNASGGAAYLSFVGFATALYLLLHFVLLRKREKFGQASIGWLCLSCALCLLWLTAAAALAGAQPYVTGCSSSSYHGIPCKLGNASLAFAWIAWIFTFGNLVCAAIYFWLRNDFTGDRRRSIMSFRGGVLPGRTSTSHSAAGGGADGMGPYKTMREHEPHGASAGFNSISRPIPQQQQQSDHAYPPA